MVRLHELPTSWIGADRHLPVAVVVPAQEVVESEDMIVLVSVFFSTPGDDANERAVRCPDDVAVLGYEESVPLGLTLGLLVFLG